MVERNIKVKKHIKGNIKAHQGVPNHALTREIVVRIFIRK
jgi:hypothetical protein